MDRLEEMIREYEPERAIASRERKRIMVIDDEPGIRDALSRVFREHDVATYETAEPALASIDGRTALVILDVKLPKINGHEVYRLIRERFDMPIIFHTAYAGEDASDCLELKPFDYIFKGTLDSYERLCDAVSRALQ